MIESRWSRNRITLCGVVLLLLVCGCGPGGKAVWSLLIPGMGQFMNNENGKGATFLTVGILAGIMSYETELEYIGEDEYFRYYEEDYTDTAKAFRIIHYGTAIWSAIDAYQVGSKLAEAPIDDSSHKLARTVQPPIQIVLDPLNKHIGLSYRF